MDFDSSSWMLLKAVGPLLGVIFCFLTLIFLYRFLDQKWLNPQGPRIKSLKIVESLYLDPKKRVVRIQDQCSEYVILLSANGDHILNVTSLSSAQHSSSFEKAKE